MINLKSKCTYNLYLFILFFVTLFLSHPWECHSSKNNKKNGTSKNILFPLCQVVLNIFCSSLPQWSLHLQQTPPGLLRQPVCGELFLQSPEHFSVCGKPEQNIQYFYFVSLHNPKLCCHGLLSWSLSIHNNISFNLCSARNTVGFQGEVNKHCPLQSCPSEQ